MTTNHTNHDKFNIYKNFIFYNPEKEFLNDLVTAQFDEVARRAKIIQDNHHLIPANLRAGADSFMKKTEDLYVKHTLTVLAKKIVEPQYPANKSVSLFHNDLGKDFILRVLDRCEKILVALGFKVRIKHEGHFSELFIAGQENSTKSL